VVDAFERRDKVQTMKMASDMVVDFGLRAVGDDAMQMADDFTLVMQRRKCILELAVFCL
jgi:hypothetical protein